MEAIRENRRAGECFGSQEIGGPGGAGAWATHSKPLALVYPPSQQRRPCCCRLEAADLHPHSQPSPQYINVNMFIECEACPSP